MGTNQIVLLHESETNNVAKDTVNSPILRYIIVLINTLVSVVRSRIFWSETV